MDCSSTERSSADRSNEDWLRLLADPDSPAHDDLRARLVTGLRRALAKRSVSGDLIEDFAQDAMLRIREHIAKFRGESRFTTWALSIAMRVAFDELRRARWRDVSFEALTGDKDQLVDLTSSEPQQEKALARARLTAALHAVIDGALTDKQRAVLVAELRGMPHEEIARNLGLKRNALHKLSHDARRKVKSTLAQAGLHGPDLLWAFE